MSDQIHSRYESAYMYVKNAIINGKFKPGEKLIESTIAKNLNISRTPVREALRKLEEEGLVTFNPSQGAKVTEISVDNVINLYECRAVLEGLAIRQAVKHITRKELNFLEDCVILANQYSKSNDLDRVITKNTEFHDLIINTSQNEPLIQMMDQIRTNIFRHRVLTSVKGFRKEFLKEHEEIYVALKDKNEDLAEHLMKKHILNDLKHLLNQLEEKRDSSSG